MAQQNYMPGLFETEHDYRQKKQAQRQQREQGLFSQSAVGRKGAFLNELAQTALQQFGPEDPNIQAIRDSREGLIKAGQSDDPYTAYMGMAKQRLDMGDIEGSTKLLGVAQQLKPKTDPDANKGWFRDNVVVDGKKRVGLYKPSGELVRYLGEGEAVQTKDSDKGSITELINPNGNRQKAYVVNGTVKNWLGSDDEKGTSGEGLQAKVFYNQETGEYISGSYDKKTGMRTYLVGNEVKEVPNSFVDATLRITKEHKLSDKAILDLQGTSDSLDSWNKLETEFDNSYGGWGASFVGDAIGFFQKRVGKDSGHAAWWQGYETQKNKMRHELFGSALTKTEYDAFQRLTVHPGMSPEFIKKNLGEQKRIAKAAASKLAKSQLAKGVPENQIRGAIGEFAWSLISEDKAESQSYSEGTVIQNKEGVKMILKNGQWEPM